jgi:hypothetical protein
MSIDDRKEEFNSVNIENKDLVCKDCKSRIENKVAVCKVYKTMKPGKVLYGKECENYEKE